jgi:S-adenosylmethionine synthetase
MARHGGGACSLQQGSVQGGPFGGVRDAAARAASRCEVQVAYAIGKARPVGLFVQTFGMALVPAETIENAVGEVFDLRPAAIIRELNLLRPIYAQTAAYGHFSPELADFTWERTDRMEALRTAANV